MKDKNTMFVCNGNEEADKLLCMLESNSVLSNKMTEKITNIVLVVLSNLGENLDWVESEIKKLREEMLWLDIFSESFIYKLHGQLIMTLELQIYLNKQKNN